MKKLVGILFLLVIIGCACYFVYVNYFDDDKIIVEEERVNISEYYVYGDHMNMKGSLEIEDNGEDKDIDIISSNDGTKIEFYFSEYINDGLYLDNIERDDYYLFLKLTYENTEDEENPIIKILNTI